MQFLLLALACLIASAEEPLLLSWKFNTIYLAGKSLGLTAENSQVRMLIREVEYFNQYRVMSMKFYVRINGKCQLHTIWADKIPWTYCLIKRNLFVGKCPKRNGTSYIPSTWRVREAVLHFPNIYFYPGSEGGQKRSTGTNITQEMWEEYVNLTRYLRIPTENIENVYETDVCPKWEP